MASRLWSAVVERWTATGNNSVMPGLVPGIHDLTLTVRCKDVDGRDKPGHDN
jgi:hypothetical protein